MSFTFTVQDGDGDKVSNTLNLTVHDVTLSPITVGEGSGGATVYEAQLLGGTDAQASGALSAWTPVSLPEGQSLVPGKYTGAHGTFTVEQRADGGYQYRYALASALSTDGDRLQDADTYTLTVHDTAGNTGVVTLTVDIVDDAPKATVTTTSTTTNTSIGSDIPIRFVYTEMDGNNKIGHTMPKGDINSANDFPDYVKDAMQGVTVSSATVTYSGTSAIGSIVSGGTLYSKNVSGGYAYNMTYDGLGVDTDKKSGVDTRTDLGWESIGDSNDRLGEINFAKTSGYGISEAVVFDLPSGKTASSFSISLGAMQAGENEVALISFYRNGVLVNAIKAAATDTSTAVQNFTFSSSAIGGAYDKVVVSALDDKNTSSSDNSDFTIQAVTFGGASTGVLETATGTVSGVSADGIASIAFDSAHSQVTLAGGAIMTLAVSSDGKSVTGSVGGSTYFTATLSGVVNGQATWTFNQVHGFEVPSGSSLLNFTVTDGDGDVSTAATTPATITTPPVAMADTDTVNHGDPVVHGNVLTNDFDADGNHLTVVGVSAGSDASASTAAGSTVAGQYGSITINADGSYSYNLDNSNAAVKAMDGASLTDTFNYRISDGHGGYSTTTLQVNINDGKYSVDAKNGDTTISGGSGSDVLVGDAGGTSTSVVHGVSPVNYDVCIILDTSGSMGDPISGTTRLALAKSALTNLLTGFKDHPGIVNVNLIGFSDTVSVNLEALEASKKSDGSYLDAIINKLASTSANGGTNYEAAFKAAADWFSGKAGDNNTKLAYFLSDGVPTARTTDSGSVDYGYWSGYYYNSSAGQQMSSTEFTEALAQYQKLVDAHVQVNAIGIGSGIDADVLKYFDNTPSAGGAVTSTTTNFYGSLYENRFSYTGNAGAVSIINNAAQLSAALNAGTPDELLVNLQAVGKDSVTGGDGNDIVFGDAVTANWLLDDTSWTSAGRSGLHSGDSLAIVREYVLGTTLKGTTLTGSALESAISEAIAHELTEHSMKYGLSETARGGDDTLIGGNGDDILFGQGGADKLDGGAGHDLLVGGSGNDVLTGGDGADVFLFHPGSGSDIISDYNAAQGDVIVRVGDPAADDSIKNSSNVNIDTPDNVHTVVDVQQGHSIILSDSANHMLVGSGVSTDGRHYTITGDLGGTYDNVLVGGDGNNVIYGGSGNNYLAGGAGNDQIIGGSGDDYLFGGTGNNNLYGGAGNDHLYGGVGTDHLYGEEGNDYLDGGGSSGTGDFLYGGAGNDVLVFHKGDTIDGGTGTDVLLVKGGSLDELFGADGKLDSNITNTEVLVSGNDATMASLTDVSKLSAIGLTVGADGKVTTANTSNATWSTAAAQPHDGYDVMTCTISHTDHTTEEMTVAVLKVMHNS
ncbi:VWA domain-containing protein [Desulfovibrio desulfuricans]|uniref:VWA domain-containing protein n=1 Tax=Desulfovibrio desulfuricans TaxID=876 RepID=UPI0035B4251F